MVYGLSCLVKTYGHMRPVNPSTTTTCNNNLQRRGEKRKWLLRGRRRCERSGEVTDAASNLGRKKKENANEGPSFRVSRRSLGRRSGK
ncbi:ring finger-like protein [Sesbania bispinosa]|nr:ring finger-like protein [Sesbania bispinosa]